MGKTAGTVEVILGTSGSELTGSGRRSGTSGRSLRIHTGVASYPSTIWLITGEPSKWTESIPGVKMPESLDHNCQGQSVSDDHPIYTLLRLSPAEAHEQRTTTAESNACREIYALKLLYAFPIAMQPWSMLCAYMKLLVQLRIMNSSAGLENWFLGGAVTSSMSAPGRSTIYIPDV